MLGKENGAVTLDRNSTGCWERQIRGEIPTTEKFLVDTALNVGILARQQGIYWQSDSPTVTCAVTLEGLSFRSVA